MNSRKTTEHLAITGIRLIIFGILCGLCVGFIASLFGLAIMKVTGLRTQRTWLLFLLPVMGIFITCLYQKSGDTVHGGTDLVIESIRNKEPMSPLLAPLIFVSTVLTHLVGGSAGREGAALQMGGSLGSTIARIFRKPLQLSEKDHDRIVMTGMAAAFSALFGTPIAAVIFSLELSTVGILQYSALLPCTISSITASLVAKAMGMPGESLPVQTVPDFTVGTAVPVILLALLCALISILFCESVHRLEHFTTKLVKNPYLRSFLIGSILLIMTLLSGGQTYNGTGASLIEEAVTDPSLQVPWYAFLLKILFTAVTISAGYKGGEIVPSFFTGAMAGRVLGTLLGLDPGFSAAIGIGCMFCGITNCPIATLLICFELFGYRGELYYLLAVAFTYLFSGHFSIYHAQRFAHRKNG